jgi:pimeloyl-ACP methyl ester carboxylesterase
MPATVVLVHGGWSGSWIWGEVVNRLEERGVPVRAVDLPSCSATTPDVDFRDDAAHVRSFIDEVGGPVVLAGNSYGGVVITEAAVDNDAVKRLVYLAAFLPDADDVLSQFLAPNSFPEFGAGIQVEDNGLVSLDIDVKLNRAFAHAPDDRKELVRARSGKPMSFGSDPTAAVTAASWRTIPSTYVVCTEDLAIKPESQRQWAKERATDYVEWPSDHCPHMSRPDDVADLLAKLASDIS